MKSRKNSNQVWLEIQSSEIIILFHKSDMCIDYVSKLQKQLIVVPIIGFLKTKKIKHKNKQIDDNKSKCT